MDPAAILLAAAVAAPGLHALRQMRREGHDLLLALAGAALVSTLWSVAVSLIVAAARASAIPGSLWAALITAVLLTEAARRAATARRSGGRD